MDSGAKPMNKIIEFWKARLFHPEPELCDYGPPHCPCEEEAGCEVCEAMERFYFGEEPVEQVRDKLQLAILRKLAAVIAQLQNIIDAEK